MHLGCRRPAGLLSSFADLLVIGLRAVDGGSSDAPRSTSVVVYLRRSRLLIGYADDYVRPGHFDHQLVVTSGFARSRLDQPARAHNFAERASTSRPPLFSIQFVFRYDVCLDRFDHRRLSMSHVHMEPRPRGRLFWLASIHAAPLRFNSTAADNSVRSGNAPHWDQIGRRRRQ
jgi:hypothetical protein